MGQRGVRATAYRRAVGGPWREAISEIDWCSLLAIDSRCLVELELVVITILFV